MVVGLVVMLVGWWVVRMEWWVGSFGGVGVME